jgi:hypothetical protein
MRPGSGKQKTEKYAASGENFGMKWDAKEGVENLGGGAKYLAVDKNRTNVYDTGNIRNGLGGFCSRKRRSDYILKTKQQATSNSGNVETQT